VRVLIVGDTTAGLALALLAEGDAVTVLAEDGLARPVVRAGEPIFFGAALDVLRDAGLWHERGPAVRGLEYASPGAGRDVRWVGELSAPAACVDPRVLLYEWRSLVMQRGGLLREGMATMNDVQRCHADYDLVVVASGAGAWSTLFPPDHGRSRWSEPKRITATVYVYVDDGDPGEGRIQLVRLPGVGEIAAVPALTAGGQCHVLRISATCGGPLDSAFDDILHDPDAHLRRTLELFDRFAPRLGEQFRHAQITDPYATCVERRTPLLCQPVADLPDGRACLGLGEAVARLDPVGMQGPSAAVIGARIYADAIRQSRPEGMGRHWMRRVYQQWSDSLSHMDQWTGELLNPETEHVAAVYAAAQTDPALADDIADTWAQPAKRSGWLLPGAPHAEFPPP
jgi:hypothetical protein